MLLLKNAWFAALPPSVQANWRPHLSMVEFKRGEQLPIDGKSQFVYFPINVVAMLIGVTSSGPSTFLSFSGADFVIGFADFFTTGDIRYQATVCGGGYAFALPSVMILPCLPSMTEVAHLQVRAVTRIAEKGLLNGHCLGTHHAEQRLARALLEALDAFGDTRPITLTQRDLSTLLMLRRETVSQQLNAWTAEKVVNLKRGSITVRNRAALEAKSCGCYKAIKDFRRTELELWRSIPWKVPSGDKST